MKLSPLILALATSVIVDAGPVGIRDIPTLAKQVDGIVVGTISSNTQSGTISILEVSVNRVLKGAFVPQQIISVQWTFSQARSLQPTVKGVTGLWFLKGNAASAFWVVEPPYGGDIQVPHLFLPASTTTASDDFKYSAGASARDKVLMELLNFIETHPGSNLSMVFDVADRGDLAAAEKVCARWSNDTKQPTLQIQGIAGHFATVARRDYSLLRAI